MLGQRDQGSAGGTNEGRYRLGVSPRRLAYRTGVVSLPLGSARASVRGQGDVVRESVRAILATIDDANVVADVALVASTREAYAAAQPARALIRGDSWLEGQQRKTASALADQARAGELVLAASRSSKRSSSRSRPSRSR